MCEKTINEMLKEQRSMLEVRHAQHLSAILTELRNQYGEGVIEAVYKVQGGYCRWEWDGIAKKEGKNSIDDLIRLLWEPAKAGGLEYRVEKTDNGTQMYCTKCPVYEIYKEAGLTEWGFHLACSVDSDIVEGFNTKIGFRRTKTLMQGHECCDHFYFMKE